MSLKCRKNVRLNNCEVSNRVAANGQGFAAGGIFYNVQPGAAAQLKI